MRNEQNRVKPCVHLNMSSSEPSGLSFRFKEGQDVTSSDWALDIPDKSTHVLANELNLHLSDSTTGTYTIKKKSHTSFSDDLSNLSKCNFVAIHFGVLLLS